MEKKLQNNIGYLFIGIWLCAIIGFHKSYTIHFPKFEGFHWQTHLHGAMLMSWSLMLIVQPFLIKYNKNGIHRKLGKLGYILAPMVCYSIFEITKMGYYRDIAFRPEPSVLAGLTLGIPSIFMFGSLFTLAMINRKNPATHMRYMIATAFMLLGPGFGRILIFFCGVPFHAGITFVYYLSAILAGLFLIYDFQKGNNIKPFLTSTIILLINPLCWAFQDANWWQSIAKWFVTNLF